MAIVYGITECTTYLGQDKYRIHIDHPYDSASEIVRKRPDLFSPVPSPASIPVEQATAVPGEIRKTARNKS